MIKFTFLNFYSALSYFTYQMGHHQYINLQNYSREITQSYKEIAPKGGKIVNMLITARQHARL